MEAVIGVVAVFFVTWMIVWMNARTRDMRRRLEAEERGVEQAGGYALAGMASSRSSGRLRTSVFLLATFSVAQSRPGRSRGRRRPVARDRRRLGRLRRRGLVQSVPVFRVTAGFLFWSPRTDRRLASRRSRSGLAERGSTRGGGSSWLVAPGSVHAALLTGMLGIPADPRLVEVVGWLAYLVPVAFYVYWPLALRPEPRMAHLKLGSGLSLAAIALGLALFYPPVASPSAGPAPLSPRRTSLGRSSASLAEHCSGSVAGDLECVFRRARNAMSLSPPEGGISGARATTASRRPFGAGVKWKSPTASRPR